MYYSRKTYKGLFKPTNPDKYQGNPNNIIYRSRWELKMMLMLDTNPNVLKWSSEEIYIPYLSPKTGKMARYFPDFLIQMKTIDGKIENVLIEIKPYKETIPPQGKGKRFLYESMVYAINKSKWKAAKDWCDKRGVVFKIMTEKELGIKH